jgi:hypothetical protein
MKPLNLLIRSLVWTGIALGLVAPAFVLGALPAARAVENLTFNGQMDSNQVNFILQGKLMGATAGDPDARLIYTLRSHAQIQIEPKTVTQTCDLKARVYQGKLTEVILVVRGDGEVAQVTGPDLKDWGVRHGVKDERFLVIRPRDPGTNTPPLTNFTASIRTRQTIEQLPLALAPLHFVPDNAAFYDGILELKTHESLDISLTNLTGLSAIHPEPDSPGGLASALEPPVRLYYANADYALAVEVREKEADARKVAWEDFLLTGTFTNQDASFVLTGRAVVKPAEGGRLAVLGGKAALTSYPTNVDLQFDQGWYWLRFHQAGVFPVELRFNARRIIQEGWNRLDFEVVSCPLRPVKLRGLPRDTRFQWDSAAKTEGVGEEYASFLPSTGPLQLQWKEGRAEERGRLFYSVQSTAQIAVGPGLLRQTHLMEFKVMQGELNQLSFDLTGDGEVTRIRGEDILAWKTEGPAPGQPRRLMVQLNQPRKDRYALVIQTQTPLGVFPLALQPLRPVPSQAIRFGGHLLVVNDGAVRLEVTEARGLSQVSPEMFPQPKELAELASGQHSQAFAYRFSGGDYSLAVQADHILPELSVSQVLVYHLGETETAIDAELECDIREAPLREFYLRIPGDFTVARLNVAQLSDYSVSADPEPGWARLKVMFAKPLTGRQVLQLRLEKNLSAITGPWALPVLQPLNLRALRGYVGITAETGYRLTPAQVAGLTEVAPAFFPKKVAGLQAAYRLREEPWQATVTVERLALSIQADAIHLFTLNEGIAYGSSVLHYLIAGTPVSVLKLTAPAEYKNLEFAGRDVRNWKRTDTGYDVYLQTPVFGGYTLLATFDRPFHGQSNSLAFVGIRPLDAQSEQGSVIVLSEYPFEVRTESTSPGLLQLDPGEIPPEHRLLFDAPILAAYQYTSRPFVLQLALQPLPLGETIHQVVDRAFLSTRVSREGEVMTEARYFVKSQGHSHLRVQVSPEAQLWEAKVNAAKVVPVADQQDTLIPLPTSGNTGAILNVDLKIAGKSSHPRWVNLTAPALAVPVLLTEWKVAPDEAYRLQFQSGSLTPAGTPGQPSGFAWIRQGLQKRFHQDTPIHLGAVPALLLAGVLLLRWATRAGTCRWSVRHKLGTGLGAVACLGAVGCLVALMATALRHPLPVTPGLILSAPIQEPGTTLAVQVRNLPLDHWGAWLWSAWPAFAGLALWIYLLCCTAPGWTRTAGEIVGWTLVCWGILRLPAGAPPFFGVMLVFIGWRVLVPAWRCQRALPRRANPPESSAALAAVSGLLAACFNLTPAQAAPNLPPQESAPKSTVLSVVQHARGENDYLFVQGRLTWKTEARQQLDFLRAPAVMTRIDLPSKSLQLSETITDGQPVRRLTAREAGRFEIVFQYQVPLPKDQVAHEFRLPTPPGLVNRLTLEMDKADLEVFSPQAISLQTTRDERQAGRSTRAELLLAPASEASIGWKPRARDTRAETAVYYAELFHLFVPTAGAVEGVHDIQVRPAQGQLAEVLCQVPSGLAITDVQADFVSNWRYDPDRRLLQVQFTNAQTKPFGLRLRSQAVTSPLPYQHTNALLSLVGAAAQVGMAGLATGAEVQLDSAGASAMAPINVEDFPAALVADAGQQVAGLTLRRAFRYAELSAQLTLVASAVAPDVRVETQETLSLGEDRVVLASQLAVQIARAGLFKLSFPLPRDYEVESLTGGALSHWTELKAGGERIITLHLRGKTEGSQTFNVCLAGPGLGLRREGEAPRLVLREANKQTGQLMIVPELGLRLHVKNREGVTQLDPQKAGAQPKGILAFRLLHARWQLAFDIETVEPWIQAALLLDVTAREGQVLVAAQLDYQIENAGIKSCLLQVPAEAENVRFEGDLISDSVRSERGTNRWTDWEVKLQRRVIGNYPLRLTYQLAITNPPAEMPILGVIAKNANLQRGYLAVRSAGRLQITWPPLPPTLQRSEWQSIPASLRRNRDLAQSKDTFNILEPNFELPLVLARHDVAKVLPARIEQVDLTSVVAPGGQILTEGRLQMRPGDTRSLRLKLPATGQFWYAFVNGQSAWPWRQGDQILLMLDKNSDPAKPTSVDFFYTCPAAAQNLPGFTHQLSGPTFDLPLENITWQVYVPENWQVKDWQSTLQLRSASPAVVPTRIYLDAYLRAETDRQNRKSQEAETLLQMGNLFLQKGEPHQARRAYQAAWKLSPQDAAFNEDARVQLHNLKLQQALIGLSQRPQNAFDYREQREPSPRRPFSQWTPGQPPDYTQQQAQDLLDKNAADDNTILNRLAERLLRQQDAGPSMPEAIRAALPAQGKQLTFTGSLQVESWTDLQVKLKTKVQPSSRHALRFLALIALGTGLALLAALSRKPNRLNPTTPSMT